MSLTQETREVNDPDTPWPVRLQAGFWGLALHLQPGQSLPLPRVLLTAFGGDLDDGGNALRRHIRRHVMPSLGRRRSPAPCHLQSLVRIL